MTRGQKIAAGVVVGLVVVGVIVVVMSSQSAPTAAASTGGLFSSIAARGAGRMDAAMAAARRVVGTDSSGAPIFGTGTAADKAPAEVASRDMAAAQKEGG